jgi:hypothetical protein
MCFEITHHFPQDAAEIPEGLYLFLQAPLAYPATDKSDWAWVVVMAEFPINLKVTRKLAKYFDQVANRAIRERFTSGCGHVLRVRLEVRFTSAN